MWRAADAVLGRAVAVKLLRPEYAGNGEMLARFRAEARYAALVCHPGVVPVYDYGPGGPVGAPFLVMELVDGPSLAEVAACGPLEPAWVLDVAGQVAAGLAAAHAQGLVHRDIKPANLLLAPGGTVKITDFGIASAAGSASLTLAGTLPGTPGYLAPERAAGAPATAASDLYSLGVVAWECLAGAPPFTGTPLEIALAHADRVMPPLPAAIPGGVADLVAELTAKDPAARPASAASVAARADQLRAAIAGTATITTDRPAAADPRRSHGAPHATPRPPAAGAARRTGRGYATGRLADCRDVRRGVAHSAASPAPAASGVPAARMVIVDDAALAGQPAGPVLRQLRRAGLRPSVVRVPDGHLAPGTVISVRPAGQVLAGGTVTVTTAIAPLATGVDAVTVQVTGTTADRRHRDPVWRPAASSRIPLLTKADDLLREGASVPILGSVVGDEFAAVLTAAQSGSEAALTLLWRDANPALLRYLRVIAPDAAEDIAAETWLQVVRGLPGFRGDQSDWRAWLFTTARRRAIDETRRRARRPTSPLDDLEPGQMPSAPDAADLALHNLATQRAIALVSALPPLQAEVIMLRVVAGLDTKAVAELLGRSPGAVRVAAHRGLRRLAGILANAGVTL